MKPPTHKCIVDVDVAIAREGMPLRYIKSVSVEDYEAALRCVQWYKARALAAEATLERIFQDSNPARHNLKGPKNEAPEFPSDALGFTAADAY